MKKILLFLLLLLAVFMNGIQPLHAQHYKKDGTPDRRYRENRSPKYSSTNYRYHTTYSSNRSRSSYRSNRTYKPRYRATSYSYSVRRDKHGKIKRSESARRTFMKQTGYPHGRPGYVIDHIKPLKKGGCDCPSNMQWQTKEAARAKDKWE